MTDGGPSSIRSADGVRALVERWRGQIAPIAAISVFGLSISMSYPLLNLLLERMGASGFAIGVNTVSAAVAMVVCAPVLPRIMARIGIGRLMIGSGIGMAALFLLFPLMPDYTAWIGLRLVYGAFATAVFFASEFWIVTMAPAAGRGRVIAAYTISLSLAFMAGPLIIGLTGIDGVLPFAVGAAILLLGLVPVVWGLGALPRQEPEAPPHPRATLRFFVTDPVVVWGVVLFGATEYGTVALLPVWGVRTGFSEGGAVLVAASFAAGAILLAHLLGWAGDRFDRRRLLGMVAVACVAAPLGMIAVSGSLLGVIALGLLWGGMAVGLYTLALTELGARYSGARLSEANAAVVLGYGIGALVSPVALGEAMDRVPPDGLLWCSGALALTYAGLVALRLRVRRRGRAVR